MDKETKSTIKVYVRVRPVIASEKLSDKVVEVQSDVPQSSIRIEQSRLQTIPIITPK